MIGAIEPGKVSGHMRGPIAVETVAVGPRDDHGVRRACGGQGTRMSFAVTPPPSVLVDAGPGGVLRLRSALPLPPVAPSLPHLFDEIASAHPDRVFLRQRDAEDGWRSITYAAARRAAEGLAQWLIDRGVGFGDCVSFLSGPSIEHGIAAIGVQRSGAAIAPVSVGYSLLSNDHIRLRDCVGVVGARVVIVDDATRYAPAMRSIADLGVIFVAVEGDAPGLDVVSWADVVATLAQFHGQNL